MRQGTKILLIIFGGFLIVFFGFYGWTSFVNKGGRQSQKPSGTSTVNDLELKIPDLDREINIPSNVPESIAKSARSKIKELSAALKKNPDLFNLWMDLGSYRKAIGDYEAARDIWEYASAIRPKNSISFGNLGSLYALYLRDYEKAEFNFLKAIENDPHAVYLYYKAFEFYRDFMKDKDKARAIIERGIEANPSSKADFQKLLTAL
jgi:tetratricopeptide (TPR) repeat protein